MNGWIALLNTKDGTYKFTFSVPPDQILVHLGGMFGGFRVQFSSKGVHITHSDAKTRKYNNLTDAAMEFINTLIELDGALYNGRPISENRKHILELFIVAAQKTGGRCEHFPYNSQYYAVV